MKTTIQLKHRSGKVLNVEVIKSIWPNSSRINFKLFDSIVNPTIRQEQKALCISSLNLKGETKKQIEDFFGVKVNSKSDILLVITDESYSLIEKVQKDFDLEVEEWRADYNKRAAELPVWHEMYDFLDWGDYTINSEREIRVFRKPLPEDRGEEVLVIAYQLWNMSDGVMTEEWQKDFKESGGSGDNNSVAISEELAKKWIEKHAEIQREIQRKRDEKNRIEEEKRVAEEKRRAECFAEAKRTGQKVILHTYFLSGDDIPRRFRDDDSDMGTLITYAMPDGSVKEEFSHSF